MLLWVITNYFVESLKHGEWEGELILKAKFLKKVTKYL